MKQTWCYAPVQYATGRWATYRMVIRNGRCFRQLATGEPAINQRDAIQRAIEREEEELLPSKPRQQHLSQSQIYQLIKRRHNDPKTRRKIRAAISHAGRNYHQQIEILSEDEDDTTRTPTRTNTSTTIDPGVVGVDATDRTRSDRRHAAGDRRRPLLPGAPTPLARTAAA